MVVRLVGIDDDRLAKTWLVLLGILLLADGLHLTRLARSADHHIDANTTTEEQREPHANLPEDKHAVVAACCGLSIVATSARGVFSSLGIVIICGTIAHLSRNYNLYN